MARLRRHKDSVPVGEAAAAICSQPHQAAANRVVCALVLRTDTVSATQHTALDKVRCRLRGEENCNRSVAKGYHASDVSANLVVSDNRAKAIERNPDMDQAIGGYLSRCGANAADEIVNNRQIPAV